MDEELRKYKIPFSCPLCGLIMKGKSTQTYLKHGVCIDCTIQFIEGREARWASGWRPPEEQLKAYLARRDS